VIEAVLMGVAKPVSVINDATVSAPIVQPPAPRAI